MKLSKSIEGFIISRIAEGYSQSTIIVYQSCLRLLTKYLDNPDIETITGGDLKQFFYFLRTEYKPDRPNGDTRPLTESAIHGKWKAVRSLWSWANEELGIENVALVIKMPTYANKEIVPFTEDEVRALLRACDFTASANTDRRKKYSQRRPSALRDRLILLVFLDTGIRLGELTRLRVRDVNLQIGEVHIVPFGRGHKTEGRIVQIGSNTKRVAWRYLAGREIQSDLEGFFLNDDGQTLQGSGIKSLCRRLGERADVKNVHPHRFRHTFAICYLRNGGDVFTLQRLLGHSSLNMVRRYLALADVDSAEAHRKASPVDRWRL